jgi:hypothetical protein
MVKVLFAILSLLIQFRLRKLDMSLDRKESFLSSVSHQKTLSSSFGAWVWAFYSPTHTPIPNILTLNIDVALFKWLDISHTQAECQRITDFKHYNVADRMNRLVKRLTFFKLMSVLTVTILLLNCPPFKLLFAY